MYKRVLKLKKSFLGEIESRSGYYCYLTFYEEHPRANMLGVSFDRLFNPIQTGLFLAFPGLRGGDVNRPPPLHFLKAMEEIDMKLTPLIKRREINLLLLSYLSCAVA